MDTEVITKAAVFREQRRAVLGPRRDTKTGAAIAAGTNSADAANCFPATGPIEPVAGQPDRSARAVWPG
ncbi:hypothetical protein [Actinokineospora diospyrosa]|uniref:hypothetical protein n=1 Tax=Actinokineospora diospyrosa TaxID=103728 RepID=UPI0020A35186|nr:hypothetical protein [Actinokineospora diospyrosa]